MNNRYGDVSDVKSNPAFDNHGEESGYMDVDAVDDEF
jgi:hypothetical protein